MKESTKYSANEYVGEYHTDLDEAEAELAAVKEKYSEVYAN